jgi:polyphosphate kinase
MMQALKKQLDVFLESQWKDNVKARIIDASLSNQKRKAGQRPFRSQVELKKIIAKGTR